MLRRLVLVIAGGVCFSPLLGGFLHAQEPASPPPPRGLSPAINRREPPKDAGPAPRSADGRVLLGAAAAGTKDKGGLWTPLFGILDPILEYPKVPFQPWAKALYEDRQLQELEPHARCHPSGVARQFMTPYGVEIVENPELQRVYIMDEGGPHTFRTVYMDGRSHPKNLVPSAYGHSIGWWEGDTFVVDSIGFNEKFWLDRRGLPHTEQLHTLERFTRVSALGMMYEGPVDDPGAYTAPWTGWFYMQFNPGQELWEYVCQQSNFAPELMVGSFDKVDRTTTIVP
jgi:hypothetical protein